MEKLTEFKLVDSDEYFDLYVQSYAADRQYSSGGKGTFVDTETGEDLGNPAITFKRLFDDSYEMLIPCERIKVKWVPEKREPSKNPGTKWRKAYEQSN